MTKPLTIAVEAERHKHLKECEEILNWLEKEATEIEIRKGIHWHPMQWQADGLKYALLSTKRAMDRNDTDTNTEEETKSKTVSDWQMKAHHR